MSRRTVCLLLLALANVLVFAVAEAVSGVERASAAQARESILVAVLDTGVAGPSSGLEGVDLVDDDGTPADDNGHGTAVAARITATCPTCTILPVRVLSRSGSAPWSRVAAGIVWAVDHGAAVINISIAGPGGSEVLREAVAYAVARDVLVVASAGNRGDDVPQYPAAYNGVVGVAARTAGRLADWSSRGSWVDVAAPGCSPVPVGGAHAWACGTSFAAPLAAGLAGLARSIDPNASAQTIARRLPALLRAAPAPAPAVEVSGLPTPGVTLRATATGLDRNRNLGESIRWFRCAAGAEAHACTVVSRSVLYRVRVADAGWTLVARVVTTPFAGLWLASSPRLAVA